MSAAAVALISIVAAPRTASAESLFDFLFGGLQKELQKVAPVNAETIADETTQPVTIVLKSALKDGKHAEAD